MADLHALLVGIDRHDPQRIPGDGLIPDLQGSVHDVERMERFLLQGPLAVRPEQIRKLVSPALRPGRSRPMGEELPTYRNLIRELEALADRADRGDQVLIHYSGHGASLPTVVPEKKGRGGRDECLVPCDAAVPAEEGGGFLRDVELYALLRRFADEGLRVTLILDCCHSGGITRAVERGEVRGLGRLSVRPGEAGPLGSWEALGALLPEHREVPPRERFRHLEGASGWFPQPEGCVLLAACLSTESAREYGFDDGRWSGALTHFLLEAMGDLGPRPTYRWLHHRLLGRIRGLFKSQTPVLEGDGELAFLGSERWPERRGVPVLETARDGRLLLGAGRAQGLGPGARLEFRPDGGEGECVAELEVLEAAATTAWARAKAIGREMASARPVGPGDLAVVVDPGRDTRRYRVGTVSPVGYDAAHRLALARVRESVGSGARPLLVAADEVEDADFRVEVTPGGFYRILNSSGEPFPHQGEAIAIEAPDGVDRLLDRLGHLARYRAVEDLKNPDASSPFFGQIRTELFALDRAEDWQDEEARIPVGALPVPIGTYLCLLVRNDSQRDVSVVVLDLQPDWGISRAHPNRGEGDFTTLPAGRELPPIFLKACLPDWMNEGRDRLKVIAATGPLDTTHLELDALGESTGYRSFRGPDPAGDLRTRMFTPSRSGPAFRTMEAFAPVSHDWAVETVEVGVVRHPDNHPDSRGSN